MTELWRCPVCGWSFSKPNQWHSHGQATIASHFEGKPEARAIFEALKTKLEKFGPLRTDAVKSSINLIAKYHYGAVHPLKDGLRVGFLLHRKIENDRIIHHEWVGGDRWGHHVKLSAVGDIDAEFLGWMKEAYGLAA